MFLASRLSYTSRSTTSYTRFAGSCATKLLSLPWFRMRSFLTEAAGQPFPEPLLAIPEDPNTGKPDEGVRGQTPATRTPNAAPTIRDVFQPSSVRRETAVYSVGLSAVPAHETITISVNINEQATVIAQPAFTFIPTYDASTQLLNHQQLFISDLAVGSQGASVQVHNMSDNGIEVPANMQLGVVFVPRLKSSTTGEGIKEDDENLTEVKVRRIDALYPVKIRHVDGWKIKRIDGLIPLKIRRVDALSPVKIRRVESLSPVNIIRVYRDALRSQRHQEDKITKFDKYHRSFGKLPKLWEISLAELEEHSLNQAEAKVEVERPSSTDSLPMTRPQKRFRIREVHAKEIPIPLRWSKTSFMDYIEDLATSEVSRSLHRQIYSNGTTHDEIVARLINRCLKDPSMSSYMSSKACNIAFEFYYKHSMISRARSLFLYMEDTNMVVPLETFNIMLRGAAAQSSTYAFTYILRLMIRRELQPNSESWAALIMIIHSMGVKSQILQFMFDRGLLENQSTNRFALSLAVRGELVNHLDQGRSLVDVLNSMDKKYGSLWISVSACNNMLDEINKRGRMREAYDLLEIMSRRGLKPNNVTLNTILGHCFRLQDLGLAIEILRYFEHNFQVRLLADKQGQIGFDTLFRTAWRKRDLNSCKVIWRHACLRRAVSYRMQHLVTVSLSRNTPDIPRTRQEYWVKTAGKIIANIENEELEVEDLHMTRADLLGTLTSWAERGADRHLQRRLAACIINRDLATARRYRPRQSLVDDLEKATDIDVTWARDRVWKLKDMRWMLDHATEVQIEPLLTQRFGDTNRVAHKHSWYITP